MNEWIQNLLQSTHCEPATRPDAGVTAVNKTCFLSSGSYVLAEKSGSHRVEQSITYLVTLVINPTREENESAKK